jgi:M6 family metalloprotease-like protein
MAVKHISHLMIILLVLMSIGRLPHLGFETRAQANDVGDPSASGPQSIIVILVEFQDLKHTISREEIYREMFLDMDAYYKEISYNKTWIVGNVTNRWYELPGSWKDYAWTPPVTEGPWTDAGNTNTLRLVKSSITASDGEVDFTRYKVACIVTAGKLGMDTIRGAVFPGWAPLKVVTNDGAYVSLAMIDSETSLMATIAHELGHILGLPDLYDSELMRQTAYGPSQIMAAHFVGIWDNMGRWGNCQEERR